MHVLYANGVKEQHGQLHQHKQARGGAGGKSVDGMIIIIYY